MQHNGPRRGQLDTDSPEKKKDTRRAIDTSRPNHIGNKTAPLLVNYHARTRHKHTQKNTRPQEARAVLQRKAQQQTHTRPQAATRHTHARQTPSPFNVRVPRQPAGTWGTSQRVDTPTHAHTQLAAKYAGNSGGPNTEKIRDRNTTQSP